MFWSGAVNFQFKGDICSVLHLLMTTGLTVCSFAFLWPLAGLCFRRYELAECDWCPTVHPVHHSLVDDGLDLRDGVVDVVEECLHRSLILSTQNTALLLPITRASKSCQLQHVALRQSTHSIRRCTQKPSISNSRIHNVFKFGDHMARK